MLENCMKHRSAVDKAAKDATQMLEKWWAVAPPTFSEACVGFVLGGLVNARTFFKVDCRHFIYPARHRSLVDQAITTLLEESVAIWAQSIFAQSIVLLARSHHSQC